MARAILAACLLAGCGRLGFDAVAKDATDPAIDASPSACAVRSTAPNPIVIQGSTFFFTSTTTTSPFTGVPVTARRGVNGPVMTMATSDNTTGRYTLSIDSAGVPQNIVLEFTPPGYLATTEILDRRLDHSVTGPENQNAWTMGEGAIWSPSMMDTVYSYVGLSLDTTKATINVAIMNCAGQSVVGATLGIKQSPSPPAMIAYLDPSATPASSQVRTVLPYTYALVFNAAPGTYVLSAQAPGLTFVDQTIEIQVGATNAVMRSIE